MKIEWLVNDVMAVGSPDRAEHAILGVILAGPVFGKFSLWCRDPLLSSNSFTQGHLMKLMSPNDFPLGHSMNIEWLVIDVTAVGSPGKGEGAIYGVILAGRVFGQSRLFLWLGSHFEV